MTLTNKLPIKAFRVAKGYTQQEVAEKLGVSRNTYMNWENYETFPDAKQLIMLANILECSMDAFYFPVNAS